MDSAHFHLAPYRNGANWFMGYESDQLIMMRHNVTEAQLGVWS